LIEISLSRWAELPQWSCLIGAKSMGIVAAINWNRPIRGHHHRVIPIVPGELLMPEPAALLSRLMTFYYTN